MICTAQQILFGDQSEKNEMGGPYSTCGREERCIQSFGRESWAGIANRYGRDGPGSETRGGGQIFRTHSTSYTMGTGSFPGAKLPGRCVHHLLTSSAEVKERVERHLYSPSMPWLPVLGQSLPLSLHAVRTPLFQEMFK
jgi:hypothetical protein